MTASAAGGHARRAFADQAKPAAAEEAAGNAGAAAENAAAEGAAAEGAAAEVDPSAEKIAALEEQVAKLNADVAQAKDALLRQLAETENVRTRLMREVRDSKVYAVSNFAKDMLDVVDNFDRAVNSVSDEDMADNAPLRGLFEGLSATEKIMLHVMGTYGVKRMDAEVGAKFDPNWHEAVVEVPNPEMNPGEIAFVQQTGYTLEDRVIRAAKVGVVIKH